LRVYMSVVGLLKYGPMPHSYDVDQ
jgi:hypothetical protein